MKKMFENKKLRVAAIYVLVITLLLMFYLAVVLEDPYTTLRTDKDIIHPPLKKVYWGMTVDEVRTVLKADDDEFYPAEPLLVKDWVWTLELTSLEEREAALADVERFNSFENHYYYTVNSTFMGLDNYFVDDKPLTVRLIFTNETTYNGKTIPPLLYAVLFKFPGTEDAEAAFAAAMIKYYNRESNYRYGLPENLGGWGGDLKSKLMHKPSEMLSKLYSHGLSPEEIEKLDILNLDEYDASRTIYETIGGREWVFRRSTTFEMREKWDVNANHPEWDTDSVYVTFTAGYYAYYDWFLNELTAEE